MKYKLFVSDYDRTLGDRDYVDPSTVETIKEYERRGGKFIIISGRVIDSILSICNKYGFTGLVGAYQGAMIKDIETGDIKFHVGVDKETAISVVKQFFKDDYDTTIDIDGVRYSVKGDGIFLDHYLKFGGAVENLISREEALQKMIDSAGIIEKVCGMISPDQIYPQIERYSKLFPEKVAFNSGGPIILECINKDYDKGTAIKFIADYYKIPLSEVIAIGDSTNDVPMVINEWYGVAVGNGCDQIKSAADEVAVEFKDNPVKQMLEKYCL